MKKKHLYIVAGVIWGWILLVFMMSLGIALKHIPGVPSEFTA